MVEGGEIDGAGHNNDAICNIKETNDFANAIDVVLAFYEKHPDEHLQYTEQPLREAGVDEADIRAIMSHGWSICTDVEPLTDMEKSLFTVDELTGIIQACARMRPNGIQDLEVSSFMKKFKDKKFAAKCNRELILKGCEMLGMDVRAVAEICIAGMKPHAAEIGLAGGNA